MMQARRTIFLESCGTDEQRVELKQLKGVGFTDRRAEADVFVATDPTQTGVRTAWAARLLGSWMVAPETLQHPAMLGAGLKWKCALDTRRQLYWTEAACQAYPKVVELVKTVITKKNTRQWKRIENEAEYLHQKGKARAAKRSTLVVAIGVAAELQALSDKLPGPSVEPAKHHIFNQAEAMKFLEQLEVCRTGAAGGHT